VVPGAMAPAESFHEAVVLVHVTGREAPPARAEVDAGIPEAELSVSVVEGGPEPAALEILRTLEARKILGR